MKKILMVFLMTTMLYLPSNANPKIAFVIDDVGGSEQYFNDFKKIRKPIAFAVLPFLAYSAESNAYFKRLGYTTLLHLPLEGSVEVLNSRTEGLIYVKDSTKFIGAKLKKALVSIGDVSGINNHMGSRFTGDTFKIKELLSLVKEVDNSLFFLDSGTDRNSKGSYIAKELSIKTGRVRWFIDNEKDESYIKNRIEMAIDKCLIEETVICIGHYHPITAQAILESIDSIEKAGIEIVDVTTLLE